MSGRSDPSDRYEIQVDLSEENWKHVFYEIAENLLRLVQLLRENGRVTGYSWHTELAGQHPRAILRGDSAILGAAVDLDRSLEPVRDESDAIDALSDFWDKFHVDVAEKFKAVDQGPATLIRKLGSPRSIAAFEACAKAEAALWDLSCYWDCPYFDGATSRDEDSDPITAPPDYVARLESALKQLPNRWTGWPEHFVQTKPQRLRFDDESRTLWVDGKPHTIRDKLAYFAVRKIAESDKPLNGKDLGLGTRADRYLKKHVPANVMGMICSRRGKQGGYSFLLPSDGPNYG